MTFSESIPLFITPCLLIASMIMAHNRDELSKGDVYSILLCAIMTPINLLSFIISEWAE